MNEIIIEGTNPILTSHKEKINFETETIQDNQLAKGESKIIQEGREGVKKNNI